ncbi:BTAD domain-containing putative transcriptional regulator [Dactylosporangium maewongense]|uniref:BTAD domain-containing putative transcriptional regulator n=2 Tax=Dactylosporangium maewongense TaxID=634393 RepID=A0ABN2DB40_9ACTN
MSIYERSMADDQAAPDLPGMLHQLRRREARRRGGAELTYRDLAAATGWSLGIVAQYFSGKSLPPVDRFDVLVRLLGASPAEQGVLAAARDRAEDHRRRATGPVRVQEPARRAEVRLLGPLEVAGPKGSTALSGARQRALVGVLALAAGRVVTQIRLLDALWAEAPPRTAVATLYSHVARVRQSLDACGLPGVLLTRGPGYLLAVRPDDVDAHRFERWAAEARRALAAGQVTEAASRLRLALALWRGEALADADPVGWVSAEMGRLHELRLSAQEDLWDACLRLGEHAAAVDELEKALVTHPVRERLVELSMLAMYRCGRHTDAIEAYQRLRGRLAERLGVEPGPRVAALYASVLRRSPVLDLEVPQPGVTTPAQLPPRVGHFVGRTAELSALDGLLGGPSQVGVVCGPAGMGKTALAVQWAHRAAGRFRDGQLFLDLRGHDPATATPAAEALALLLLGLDVPAAQIPADPAALLGLYRSVLHHRQVLILLDNAATAAQVTSLVPPSAGSRLLVTSRHQLTGLTMDHAVTLVDLDVLAAGEALALLGRVIGTERVAREPGPAAALVELCGQMPLALRIAAAKLTVHPPRPIAELVAALAGADRLATLAVPGDSRSVRTVFTSAYEALSPPAARVFRRLGRHPGATFTAALASAVAGVREPEARQALGELLGAHLIADTGGDRFRFHDLIRLYAAERAGPDDAAAADRRIVEWYLVAADAANRVCDPARDRAGAVAAEPPVEVPFPLDRGHALAFLDAERANLLPVVRHAAEHGHNRATWQLAYLLTGFHMLRGCWPEQLETYRQGLAAAGRADDLAAQALLRGLLGMALNTAGRHEEALEHLPAALALLRAVGYRRNEGLALNNIAVAHCELGRLDAAAGAFGQALDLHRTDGHLPGVALALNNLGHVYTRMGEPDLAREHLCRALALAREIGDAPMEALTLTSLGEIHLAAADHEGALEQFTASLAIRRRIGARGVEAETLRFIGLAHLGRGDRAAAATSFRRALALARELADRHLESVVLAHLRTVDGDHGLRVDDDASRDSDDPHREPAARGAGRAR